MALLTSTLANLDMMRDRLFSLNEPVHLSAEQKDAYWPYVANIWCRKDKMITPQGALSKELWRCRRSRSSRPKQKVDGVKHRNRAAFTADCACFMVVTHWQNGFWTFVRRTKPHSHTLADADRKKKNAALQDAALEFIRKHGDVLKVAQKKANKLASAAAHAQHQQQQHQQPGDAALDLVALAQPAVAPLVVEGADGEDAGPPQPPAPPPPPMAPVHGPTDPALEGEGGPPAAAAAAVSAVLKDDVKMAALGGAGEGDAMGENDEDEDDDEDDEDDDDDDDDDSDT